MQESLGHTLLETGWGSTSEYIELALTGESVSGSLSLRVQQLDVRCETKTKDNVRSRGRCPLRLHTLPAPARAPYECCCTFKRWVVCSSQTTAEVQG